MRMKTPWGLLCALLLNAIVDKGCQGQEEMTTTLTPSSAFPDNTTYDPSIPVTNDTQSKEGAVCPDRCYCGDGFQRIDCSNASLLHIPPAIPPQVRYLSLRDNALTSIPVFDKLTDLRVLDISGNQLETVHDETFKQLAQLQELDLHGNQLNDVTGILNSMPGLQVLNLSHNRITDLDTLVLTNSSIRTLDARYNQISKLPNLLQFLHVESIHLSHNKISRLENIYMHDTNHTSHNISTTKTIVSNMPAVFRSIIQLDLAANTIEHIDNSFFMAYPNLKMLDLSDNNVAELANAWGTEEESACDMLQYLDLANNGFEHIPNDMFLGCCPNLTNLEVSHQDKLTHINSRSFNGLSLLESLNLSHCPNLSYIHAGALSVMPMLNSLDMSYISINSMHKTLLPSSLNELDLEGIELNCRCDTAWLQDLNTSQLMVKPQNLTCRSETGDFVPFSEFLPINCTAPIIITKPESHRIMYTIGASARFDCAVDGKPVPHVTWIASKLKHEFSYHPAFLDFSELRDPSKAEFHHHHYWHELTKYFHHIPLHDRVFVLKNGSLYIDYVTRKDAGQYQCFAHNEHGNSSLVMTVTLDYNALIETKIWCVIIGMASALGFLLIGIIAGLTRWLAHLCSREEKEKRRSIWELMVTIQEYKSEKVDVFRAYKDAKLDKFSEFKNHKIDKLRTYKQDTVTNILTHMHSMREHYQGQMAKIKDNYSDQANRLRDNYSQHITKIKDYRQEKVDHLRVNYQSQALKIRDYGAAQMQRLREQYKLQQQHMLKLLELLDIGNCMSVIEAECMRTESMLFDPDITFELDDSAVHVPLPPQSSPNSPSGASDDSEYITACSVSDDHTSGAPSVTSPRSKADKRRSSSSSDNSSLNIDHSILTANLDPEIQKMLLENTKQELRPPRKCRRKRRRHHSAQCHATPVQTNGSVTPAQTNGSDAPAQTNSSDAPAQTNGSVQSPQKSDEHEPPKVADEEDQSMPLNPEPDGQSEPPRNVESNSQDPDNSYVLMVDDGVTQHQDGSDTPDAAESIV